MNHSNYPFWIQNCVFWWDVTSLQPFIYFTQIIVCSVKLQCFIKEDFHRIFLQNGPVQRPYALYCIPRFCTLPMYIYEPWAPMTLRLVHWLSFLASCKEVQYLLFLVSPNHCIAVTPHKTYSFGEALTQSSNLFFFFLETMDPPNRLS